MRLTTNGTTEWYYYAIFGAAIRSSIGLPLLLPALPDEQSRPTGLGLTLRQVASVTSLFDLATCAPLHNSTGRTANGRPSIVIQRAHGSMILQFGSGVDFAIGHAGDAAFSMTAQCTQDDVQIALLGMVLALWLERRGITVLHAAVVVIDGCAVGFLADSQAGKSTLAAALVADGHPLLSDDLLVCQDQAGEIVAQPGFPAMRMWPDTARNFLGDHANLDRVRLGSDKRRVRLAASDSAAGFGRFCAKPAPLACIYVPQRTSEHLSCPSVSLQAPAQATATLVRHSVLSRTLRASGESPAQLSRLAGIAARVPVRTVRYSSGYDLLPGVCEFIQRDLQTSGLRASARAGRA
jgi:hypothetical protein